MRGFCLWAQGQTGTFSREIAARASNDGVASQVTLRAHVPHKDLVGFYCAADVGFFPNPTMAALEAASCGRPWFSAPRKLLASGRRTATALFTARSQRRRLRCDA